MSAPIAFLVTYANGHTVIQGGEDVLEQTEFSVSRGFATRRDLDGGAFELTSTEDGRTRRYEPVTKEQPDATRFYEKLSDDGLDWESTGIVPSSQAGRRCARQVNQGFGNLWYLASGAMVLIDSTRRRQILRYEPVGA
ncbi:hypothetical protein FNV58_01235 (plasmid) [Streptomyces sp. RLB1-9]|uniref:hypothetical protein n=1 Tax=Streptomyces sp. RLB1-9 TaxID=2594454 RepID=UPI0011658B43|nr:hypothetical protein [Streptomyces sp. RLB1-9]QDN94985.1 hypothetical protein FNV58_01235 [Streptomyces sp. RLB1-9]